MKVIIKMKQKDPDRLDDQAETGLSNGLLNTVDAPARMS